MGVFMPAFRMPTARRSSMAMQRPAIGWSASPGLGMGLNNIFNRSLAGSGYAAMTQDRFNKQNMLLDNLNNSVGNMANGRGFGVTGFRFQNAAGNQWGDATFGRVNPGIDAGPGRVWNQQARDYTTNRMAGAAQQQAPTASGVPLTASQQAGLQNQFAMAAGPMAARGITEMDLAGTGADKQFQLASERARAQAWLQGLGQMNGMVAGRLQDQNQARNMLLMAMGYL